MNRQHWIKRGGVALGLCLILALASILPALAATQSQEEPAAEAAPAEQSESAAQNTRAASSAGVDKSETVYVQSNPDGSVREITVEEVLKNPGGSGDISDFSNLSGIKNTEGDEAFTEQNGNLLWENHGEDIHYEGKSDAQLPVTVSISYYLDGKPVSPEELAGQSGRVRIRFDYENHTSETVSVDGEDISAAVPFAALSAVVLPEDVFSNIEVTNGKLISMGEQNIALGLAFPGLADSLALEGYEPAEDIDIPDYVEISADAVGFELDFTATIVSPGLFSDLEDSSLDSIDEMIEDMADLSDASGELAEGTADLSDGIGQFRTYLRQYLDGVSAVNTGSSALAEGLAQLNEQKALLADGAAALQSGLEQLDASLTQISLPSAGEEELAPVLQAAQQLAADAQTLAAGLNGVQAALDDLQAYQAQIAALTGAAGEALSTVDVASAARQAAQEALANTELSEEQKAQILDSIVASGALSAAQSQIDAARSALNGIPALSAPDLSGSLTAITQATADMQLQFSILCGYSEALAGLAGQIGSMAGALETLQSGVSALADGSRQLSDGISAFNQGIQQLTDGAAALSSGASELAQAGSQLDNGLGSIAEGAEALAEGMDTFDSEGIQALTDLAGDDLAALNRRLRAIKEADSRYTNFGGISEGSTGSVRFIIETDEIAP